MSEPTTPPRDVSLKLPNAVYSSAMISDWISTRYATLAGLPEANPLARPFVDTKNPAMMAAGLGIDVGLQVAINKLLGEHHPKWARALLYSAAIARAAISAQNVINGKREFERRRYRDTLRNAPPPTLHVQ